MKTSVSIRLFCVAAGFCDGITGVLLMCVPLWTLHLMGIHTAPTEPVYVRFIGVFVFSVGSSYFFPVVRGDQGSLCAVFGVTTWIRICVAVFVIWAICGGRLVTPWISVAGVDIVLALLQIWILMRIRRYRG